MQYKPMLVKGFVMGIGTTARSSLLLLVTA
jgi:hypothetical protein